MKYIILIGLLTCTACSTFKTQSQGFQWNACNVNAPIQYSYEPGSFGYLITGIDEENEASTREPASIEQYDALDAQGLITPENEDEVSTILITDDETDTVTIEVSAP